jgi:hypothetical protein
VDFGKACLARVRSTVQSGMSRIVKNKKHSNHSLSVAKLEYPEDLPDIVHFFYFACISWALARSF